MSERFSFFRWPRREALLAAGALALAMTGPAAARVGGFTGELNNSDRFGASLAPLGDLDGDGIPDVAVGAPGDDDGGAGLFADRGAVWILFLNADGSVKGHQKISSTEGGFSGTLANDDQFGASVANLGDLDGDSIPDLAVGAPQDAGNAGSKRGAVWILFLNANGTVKSHQKIGDATGGFAGTLDNFDAFGFAVAGLGDLDDDSIRDLAVGAPGDDDGMEPFSERGAAWILFLNANGTVKGSAKISATSGGLLGPTLDDFDQFGFSAAALPDMDADGNAELAVGAPGDMDGSDPKLPAAVGAAWVLFLDSAGGVKSSQKHNALSLPFIGGDLDEIDFFGSSVAALPDRDGDGNPELAVGSPGDDFVVGKPGGDDDIADAGAVWLIFLNAQGAGKSRAKIGLNQGGFEGGLAGGDSFGSSIASLGNIGGDPSGDLAVGAAVSDQGGVDRGVVWTMLLNPDSTVASEVEIGSDPPPAAHGWMAH